MKKMNEKQMRAIDGGYYCRKHRYFTLFRRLWNSHQLVYHGNGSGWLSQFPGWK